MTEKEAWMYVLSKRLNVDFSPSLPPRTPVCVSKHLQPENVSVTGYGATFVEAVGRFVEGVNYQIDRRNQAHHDSLALFEALLPDSLDATSPIEEESK